MRKKQNKKKNVLTTRLCRREVFQVLISVLGSGNPPRLNNSVNFKVYVYPIFLTQNYYTPYFSVLVTSVADPGCMNSVPDLDSGLYSYNNQKN